MTNQFNTPVLPHSMRQSRLFTRTRKHPPADEHSKNAQLLIRAGFIHKELAGVYTFLPLGLRVIENIKHVIREELNAVGAQEIAMTALQQKDVWERSGRWSDAVVDDWFKTTLKNGAPLGLAFTHEEPITSIMRGFISSYKDLPVFAYQFQTKFRNEMRAKSGIMRGKEFIMKDLYDFCTDKQQHDAFYETMKSVYATIFSRVGLGERTYLTMSSGGTFSKYSFEFQTITDAGEDTIVYDEERKIAINKDDVSDELFADFGLDKRTLRLKEAKSVEVGDIYSLGEKYSTALGLTYKDATGIERPVYMGSYGIGIPRLMGTIVEVHHDERGIIWPEEVTPFDVHLIRLGTHADVVLGSDRLHDDLTRLGRSVLYDDRDMRAGEKFADSDLIGIPFRVIVSEKNDGSKQCEVVHRATGAVDIVPYDSLSEFLTSRSTRSRTRTGV